MFINTNFKITEEESKMIEEWWKNHKCPAKVQPSCCGGEISITFTPTTIGTDVTACCICGETFNVRDI